MDTPIVEFVSRYVESGITRLHMPGHKGRTLLGPEKRDITEIEGADSLYEASGIIAASERNAASLFGTAATLYSTEGSSQCIRAMLTLALLHAPRTGERPVIVASRNAHKTFMLAAALLDFDIVWLWPETGTFSLCRCPVSAEGLEKKLASLPSAPAAVYLTSPDYLGGILPIAEIAKTAHGHGVPLLVDDAHGAYRRFLPASEHPISLGADCCCDSAHKTLPVLTGGAYLHIADCAPADFAENARRAMALFGSTSPSYLILQSLDVVNSLLADTYPARLVRCVGRLVELRRFLACRGWMFIGEEELKLTIAAAESGWEGAALAAHLRRGGVECEYADPDYVVLMFTPENSEQDFERVEAALAAVRTAPPLHRPALWMAKPRRVLTPREAILAPQEAVPIEKAVGRILGAPAVSCPPAVPIVASGEVIGLNSGRIFAYYGIKTVDVVKEQ